jgi:hypothetical protein
MLTMTQHEWDEVSLAVVLYTGQGVAPYPARSEDRIAARLGADAAARLGPIVRQLDDEFYESDARFVAADVADMHALASAQFRQKYPLLSPAAADAFAWCYTWDFK